jgi:predicted RNase H-like nuclease (RuvC/YqgF family)
MKQEIIKRNLLAEPLSQNALKLARGIYNTYIAMEEDLYLEIKIQNIFKLLNLHPCKDSIRDIQDLLEELNEPLAIRNFEFEGETIQLKFVQFCTYKIGEETIKIELSPEYLHAQSEYMLDSFLF